MGICCSTFIGFQQFAQISRCKSVRLFWGDAYGLLCLHNAGAAFFSAKSHCFLGDLRDGLLFSDMVIFHYGRSIKIPNVILEP